MANATENFGKVIENQQGLVKKLTEQAQQAATLYGIDKVDLEAGQALAVAYMNQTKALLEAAVKPQNADKILEELPEHFSHTMDTQADFFNKTLEFYQGLFQKYGVEYQQTNFQKLSDIYRKSYQEMVETTTVNMKLMQNLFA